MRTEGTSCVEAFSCLDSYSCDGLRPGNFATDRMKSMARESFFMRQHILICRNSLASELANGASNHQSPHHNIKTLHQHIDDLTREKLELQRGLQHSAQMQDLLNTENLTLGEQFNNQARMMEKMQVCVVVYEEKDFRSIFACVLE